MNKHLVIRSISVLLFIAFLFTLTNFDTAFIFSKQPNNISINEFNWHPDLTSEIELQKLHFESELDFHSEIAKEMETLRHFSISTKGTDYLIISSIEDNFDLLENGTFITN